MRGGRPRFKMQKSLYNSGLSIHPLETLPFAKLYVSIVCVFVHRNPEVANSLSSFCDYDYVIYILIRCSYAKFFIHLISNVYLFYVPRDAEVNIKLNKKASIENLLKHARHHFRPFCLTML